MPIRNPQDLTQAVLKEMSGAQDPRQAELLTLAVKHLHSFVREAQLTEEEFHKTCMLIASLGQQTNASHNEVTLMAGSLGVSALVCLLNNGNHGEQDTTANLMGPFWRMNSPACHHGQTLVKSKTPGLPVVVRARVVDKSGHGVKSATVDVWHSSGDGYYENQDPIQADMNLRGKFTTDALGEFWFHTKKPRGYPIPASGTVGLLLKNLGRHNMRPAHIHFMIYKEGYKTQFSQVYSSDDPHLTTDVQFGVTEKLIGQYILHAVDEIAPTTEIKGPWYSLDFEFKIEAGEAKLPRPPITARAIAPRPTLEILKRRT